VRAGLCQAAGGAHGVPRPTFPPLFVVPPSPTFDHTPTVARVASVS
jgi:hypothetical protein